MATVEYPLLSFTVPAYSMRDPTPIADGNPGWRETGNLRGDAVKDESAPPSCCSSADARRPSGPTRR